MLSAIQIAGFLNQPILQNKSMNYPHVDTNSQKSKIDQKIFGWVWSKMGVVIIVYGP